MRWFGFGAGALATAGCVLLMGGEANAAPTLRLQVSQHGDFVLLGNTLGHNCANGVPAPVVGDVGLCGLNTADTAPDVYWRADSPNDGEAEASIGVAPADARSTAVLTLPPGAAVTHALLYWGAVVTAPGTDPTITLDRPNGFTADIDGSATCYMQTANMNNAYQCGADVTALVQANGEGAYRVSGVDATPLANVNNDTRFAGWWMVVLYQLPADPLRNLAVFDGLDIVSMGNPQNAVLSGFLVPNGGIDGKLGLAVFEGDSSINGDQFFFNGGAALTDAQNPQNNFFNASRSNLGATVSVDGDLPQLTGGPGSMSGLDLDIVNITNKLMAGQTMAPIQATSSQDLYYLAGFVTSVSDYRPDFTTSTKTATDLNGGALLPGDVLEYAIHAVNTGNDTAIDVVLTDPLPAGVTYVPDSLEITMGPNAGAKTDAPADDQGEYDANTNTVVFRIGTGADGVNGGVIPVGESTDVKFQVTIDADAQGTINNQGVINAAGMMGSPPDDTPTDGNGGGMGSPPTDVDVDQCEEDADCGGDTPLCNTDLDPNLCVQCIGDGDCSPEAPTCNQTDFTCECVPSGEEVCDGIDNDCNMAVDEGFGVGEACSAGVGECAADGDTVCNADGDGVECSAVPGQPAVEVCDRLDNDCDDQVDNECVACDDDSDCGAPDSGMVCDGGGVCIDGCRGTGGNGCPLGETCTSDDDSIGQCVPSGATESDSTPTQSSVSDSLSDSASDTDSGPTEASASASDSQTDAASATDSASDSNTAGLGIDDEGFGCECDAEGQGGGGGLLLLGVAGLALGRRRRRG